MYNYVLNRNEVDVVKCVMMCFCLDFDFKIIEVNWSHIEYIAKL